ncbi:MAG: DUF1453 family protein [Sphingomonas sp.]|uniref:CcdC protein domain-containing protein n=1 Tax=Sphingomonas sp. TaxID=28214 RepID=UPI0017E8AA1F|nr:DUF1453 family protein [Sphingomonas sp.]
MTDPAQPNGLVGTIFLIAFIAFVLAMRFRRMQRGRRLRLEWLWVVPALVGSLTAALLYIAPPKGMGWAVCAGALAVGALLGWVRARAVAVVLDPDTDQLSQRESPLVILFVIAIIGLRFAVRHYGTGADAVGPVLIADALVVALFGLLTVQRIMLWRRGRALRGGARGR